MPATQSLVGVALTDAQLTELSDVRDAGPVDADALRARVLRSAGFRLARPHGPIDGPATVLETTAALDAVPETWIAHGWATNLPAWLGAVSYLGALYTAELITTTTDSHGEHVLSQRTTIIEDLSPEAAAYRALDERLWPLERDRIMQQLHGCLHDGPLIVEQVWEPKSEDARCHHLALTVTSDHPAWQHRTPTLIWL